MGEIKKLKKQDVLDLQVYGSSQLIQKLKMVALTQLDKKGLTAT